MQMGAVILVLLNLGGSALHQPLITQVFELNPKKHR